MLATTSTDTTARVWDVATGTSRHMLVPHADGAYGVAFSPDGGMLATTSGVGVTHLWETASGDLIRSFSGPSADSARGVAFSPDGTVLATTSNDHAVRLRDVAGDFFQTLTGHEDAVLAVAYSPDGRYLASAGLDRTVRIWE
jgi:WD40 repeat protein